MGVRKCDLTGQRFGRLVILEYAGRDKRGNSRWLCKCDCGNEKVVNANNLKQGLTTSCGCYQKEITTIHGYNNDPLYKTWKDMHRRCKDKKSAGYDDYGGRGIRVDEEWDDFEAFRNWSRDNGHNSELSIDRIDVNGDYTPSNCRWADWTTQANNKRSNRFYTYNGITHTIAEWARIFNVPYNTLRDRINRNNTYNFIEYFGERRR